jgi:hypothetical protein
MEAVDDGQNQPLVKIHVRVISLMSGPGAKTDYPLDTMSHEDALWPKQAM